MKSTVPVGKGTQKLYGVGYSAGRCRFPEKQKLQYAFIEKT